MNDVLHDRVLAVAARLNPEPTTRATPEQVRASEAVLAALLATPADDDARLRSGRPSGDPMLPVAVRRPRAAAYRYALVAAAAAVLVATAVVVPLTTARPASAEAVLLHAAEQAGLQDDPWDGQPYWHQVREYSDAFTGTFLREDWVAPDGAWVMRDGMDAAIALQEDGVANPSLVRTLDVGQLPIGVGQGSRMTLAQVRALPTEPAALAAALRPLVADFPQGTDEGMWDAVTFLIGNVPTSPALRRALWEVAAGIPGVTLLGQDSDATGRSGTAVERDMTDENWHRQVLVLDPTTGALLETRTYDASGALLGRSTVLSSGPAASHPPIDPPACGPGSVPDRSC